MLRIFRISSPTNTSPTVRKRRKPIVTPSDARELANSEEAQTPIANDRNMMVTSASMTKASCIRLTPPINIGIATTGRAAIRVSTMFSDAAAVLPNTTS